jgi:hypothetical protein
MGFLISPFISPFAFGFLVARAKSVSPFLDTRFLKVLHILAGDGHTESVPCTVDSSFSLLSASDVRRKSGYHYYGSYSYLSRMYERGVKDLPPRPAGGLRYRIETLVGVTGSKLAKYRASWFEAISAPFNLFWRPHLLSIMVFEVPCYS